MYLDLRITPEMWPLFLVHFEALKIYLFGRHELIRYIVGFEKTNKYGEVAKHHYHIAIEYTLTTYKNKSTEKDTIAKYFNRNYLLKTNAMYCLRVHETLDDIDRYFRYVCKEEIYESSGFSVKQLDEYTILSKDEKARSELFHCNAREANEAKSNFRNKMFISLKKLFTDEKPSRKTIWIEICKFYQESYQSPPWKKIDDVVLDFQVYNSQLTLLQMYDERHPDP